MEQPLKVKLTKQISFPYTLATPQVSTLIDLCIHVRSLISSASQCSRAAASAAILPQSHGFACLTCNIGLFLYIVQNLEVMCNSFLGGDLNHKSVILVILTVFTCAIGVV